MCVSSMTSMSLNPTIMLWKSESSLIENNTYGSSKPRKIAGSGLFCDNSEYATLPSVILNFFSEMVVNSEDDKVLDSIDRLTEIENLTQDWNGYGALPFSQCLIQKCKNIVTDLSHQPLIFPTGRQSIQFQYERDDRSYLEFEIFDNKTVCLKVPKRIYSEAEEQTIFNSEKMLIQEMVDEFFGGCNSEG